jgi:phosphatidylserine/phosphatidylglycerophosphate/cardiolipin synthase-like enzyme
VEIAEWFLSPVERGNPDTRLDDGRPTDVAWSEGNLVRPLIHGATYYARLTAAVARLSAGDLLLFVDWRGDPDQRLTDESGSRVADLLCGAAERGVAVRGLVWRSHLDKLAFSARENRSLDEEVNAAGGVCLLDMRVRPGGSHHQKFVVLRYRNQPELDVAFVGGIDLCHSRRDDATHGGDPQRQPMAAVYGARPPWHDVQLEIRGPAVTDVETVFRERWDDPQPLSRSPIRWLADRVRAADPRGRTLPNATAAPEPVGDRAVQVLRTYPMRRGGGYSFARRGERSVARGYLKALDRARRLIYLEDQYLWSREIAGFFADVLRRTPELQLVAVLPHFPDQDGRLSSPPNQVGRLEAFDVIRSAAPGRFAAYGIENSAGTPVYVHAKVCVVDDVWASVGSDNVNRRSWTHDSELSVAILDQPATNDGTFARSLRIALAREHLERTPEQNDDDLRDPIAAFATFRRSAHALQTWYDRGAIGPRPPGRLRPIITPPLSASTRRWAGVLYRTIYDPDGRSPTARRTNTF